MKVKIDNTIYDSNDTPILLILSKEDKENIKNMEDYATKYLSYPNEMDSDKALDFMRNVDLDEYKKPNKTINENEIILNEVSKSLDFNPQNLRNFLSHHSYWNSLGFACDIEPSNNNTYIYGDEEFKRIDDDEDLPFYLVQSKRKYLDDYFFGNILIPLKNNWFWKIEYSIE